MRFVELLYQKFFRMLQILFKPIGNRLIKKKELELQNQNNNMDFSLIVHTCIGGVIYHRLGMRFLSPTINLWLNIGDYVKLCQNLEYYMDKDVEFIPTNKHYPVGKIGDITIYFEHYKSEEEALEKWEDRKQRINYDKLYGIAMIHNLREYEVVKPLLDENNFKKICVLSNVMVDDERVMYIPPNKLGNNRLNYLDKDLFGFRCFEKKFDFMSFLN